MPPSKARELLTRQIAIATNLAGVLRRQIGRALAELRRAARRATLLRVDGDSARHAAWLVANAERNAAIAARRADLVEQARAIVERQAPSGRGETRAGRPAGRVAD
jgi:hypothetical protein